MSPPIPPARLTTIENLTPFSLFQCRKMGPGRAYNDVVTVKAALALTKNSLEPIGGGPIVLGDEVWDSSAPERSSLMRAGDIVLCKPGTDVLVTGSARAPDSRPAPQWEVAVAISSAEGRSLLSHALRVSGPRRWEHRAMRGWALTTPEPALDVPIRYELAYGGAYREASSEEWTVCEANPSGKGFYGPLDKNERYPAPQWELRDQPLGEPNEETPLAGLGPIARPWSARSKYAGTYDDAWVQRAREEAARGVPLDYAPDFDLRFFQCAHPALIAKEHLRGDERIGLRGLLGGNDDWLAQLPGTRLRASLASAPGAWSDCEVPLDTIHVDLDRSRVYLSWRLSLAHARNIRAAVFFEPVE